MGIEGRRSPNPDVIRAGYACRDVAGVTASYLANLAAWTDRVFWEGARMGAAPVNAFLPPVLDRTPTATIPFWPDACAFLADMPPSAADAEARLLFVEECQVAIHVGQERLYASGSRRRALGMTTTALVAFISLVLCVLALHAHRETLAYVPAAIFLAVTNACSLLSILAHRPQAKWKAFIRQPRT